MANHSARAAIRHDESGKGKYLPSSVLDAGQTWRPRGREQQPTSAR
jgi:hypothetical protein